MPLGEFFFEAFKKNYSKKAVLYVPFDIKLYNYLQLDKYFDLRKYTPKENYTW